jgi:integrase
MSVYKDPRSPFWQFDFQLAGHRFHGSAKATTKRDAEAVERREREKAKQLVAQIKAARTSLRLQDVATRYWTEIGEHHSGSQNTWHQLGLLLKFFGQDKLLTDITGDDVAKLVAWRRGQPGKGGRLLSAYAVNDTTEQLKKLFTRAKVWGVRFEHEPKWRDHWLKEPQERVRELADDEAERLEAATRDDYAPFFRLAQATGLRLRECLLRWNEVDWNAGDTGQIRKLGKGGRLVTRPITSEIRAILWPLQGHHPEHVFTFVAQRDRDGRKKGERYPLSYNGVKSHWRYLRKRAGVTGFRFHDFRHDFGTKLLRATGNLKLVQKALNHANLKTTSRYAHVLDDEVAAAMERVAQSRKKSRTKLRIVS